MPLSGEERLNLIAAAEAEGFDPERVAGIVAAADMPEASEPDKPGATPAADIKIYQYQLPFMRAREVRAYLKMIGAPLDDEPMPEDDLPAGLWLAKYGGALGGGAAATAADAAADVTAEMPPVQ